MYMSWGMLTFEKQTYSTFQVHTHHIIIRLIHYVC
jgi:hypothetical protein